MEPYRSRSVKDWLGTEQLPLKLIILDTKTQSKIRKSPGKSEKYQIYSLIKNILFTIEKQKWYVFGFFRFRDNPVILRSSFVGSHKLQCFVAINGNFITTTNNRIFPQRCCWLREYAALSLMMPTLHSLWQHC